MVLRDAKVARSTWMRRSMGWLDIVTVGDEGRKKGAALMAVVASVERTEVNGEVFYAGWLAARAEQ